MNNFWKTLISITVVTLVLSMLYGVVHAVETNYASNAPINFILICVVVSALVYLAAKGLKNLWMSLAVVAMITLQSCNYAKSNQQVLTSSDCGVTWSLIKAGESATERCLGKPHS